MNIKEIRILFMGTPEISAKVLRHMLEENYNIVGVVCQPDRPVGRKHIIEKVPTKIVAEQYNIPVFQPEKIRVGYIPVLDVKPELILTLAYGQIVPVELLKVPKYGSLNLHGSILPKYRGAAPIQYALINNDKVTGMTLMEMIDKMDAGKIYVQDYIEIDDLDNCSSLFDKMGDSAIRIIDKYLQEYLDKKLVGIEQDESLVSFCPTIKKEQEKLDLSNSIYTIHGFIRALSDEPGAYLLLNNEKIKIYKSKVFSNEIKGKLGEIIEINKNQILLQCKDGVLSLIELQREGKKRLNYKDFANGNASLIHTILN